MNDHVSDEDKRRFPRVPKEVNIEVMKLSYPMTDEAEIQASGTNISMGGLRIHTHAAFDKGSKISLNIKIKGWQSYKKPHAVLIDASGKETLTAIGEVVWCRPARGEEGYDVGVKFVDIYEDDYRALMKFIAEAFD